jgi:hypothetical protein
MKWKPITLLSVMTEKGPTAKKPQKLGMEASAVEASRDSVDVRLD